MREFLRIAHSVKMSAEDSELAEVFLYGEIVQDYSKWYKEQYPNDKSASDFAKEIKKVRDDGAKKVMMRINSPGGIVFEAVAMRSILVNAGFEEITIRIEGLCASAATILATIPTAHVQIAEGSEFMIHNPWTIAWGFAEDLEHEAEHLRNMEKTIRRFYAAKSGQSDEQLKTWIDAETWMSADEALERGFCDELLKAETENAEPAAASVSRDVMAVMNGMYKHVPAAIAVKAEEKTAEDGTKVYAIGTKNGSNDDPVAGLSSSNKNKEEPQTMEIKDCTREQLLAENPALAEEIRNQAVADERDRVAGIDEMTLPGFEAEAEKAKADGTSVADFIKACRAANAAKKAEDAAKGAQFGEQRAKETAPAANVAPGAAEDEKPSEEDEIKAEAEKNAKLAAEMIGGSVGMF